MNGFINILKNKFDDLLTVCIFVAGACLIIINNVPPNDCTKMNITSIDKTNTFTISDEYQNCNLSMCDVPLTSGSITILISMDTTKIDKAKLFYLVQLK